MCINSFFYKQHRRERQRGLTLIELVIFIVIVSVGLAGILLALNYTNRNSANPMLNKQQIAIAESLLEEIESKAFTYCDPDDANVTTATSAIVGVGTTNCATTAQLIPPTAGESRGSQTVPFDNVGDYAGFTMSGISNPFTGSAINGLGSYTASVAITQVGTTAPTNVGVAADVLQIVVTVTAPSQPNFILTGYRYRYAPNSP